MRKNFPEATEQVEGEKAAADKAAADKAAKEKEAADAKAKADADAKTAAEAAAKPGDKPADKPVEKVEEEKFSSGGEMRRVLNERKQRIAALEKSEQEAKSALEKAQVRIAEVEPLIAVTPESKALSEKLAAIEKHNLELQARLEVYDFQESPQYQQQFKSKWDSAAGRAMADIKQLTVEEGDKTRAATAADMDSILSLPTAVAAARKIRELFGDDAPLVQSHYNQLRALQAERDDALSQHKQTFEQRRKDREAELGRQASWKKDAVAAIRADMAKRKADILAPEDPDEKKLVTEAMNSYDAALTQRAQMSLDKQVIFDETVRARQAASFVLEKRMEKIKATHESALKEKDTRIAELESQIKQYEESGPGPGRREAGETGPVEENIWEAARKDKTLAAA
jgi:hypothetical protein